MGSGGYMSKDNDSQVGLVLLAFVMGAVTGAAAALLVRRPPAKRRGAI